MNDFYGQVLVSTKFNLEKYVHINTLNYTLGS